ncbi:MAG: hypothetical protein WC332_02040 [Clostridia bacterium]|jgi:hypothetical protein
MKFSVKDRIIPCPKNIKTKESYTFFRNRTRIVIKTDKTPIISSGYEMLNSLCVVGYINPNFTITLKKIDDYYPSRELDKCTNKKQAYIIKPVMNDKVFSGMDLLAYTDIGLYYACSTLYQSIIQVSEKEIEIPVMEVSDWPSIEYRGMFLGDYVKCLPYTSMLKLNALDYVYNTKNKDKENEIYSDCRKLGITPFSAIFEWEDPIQIFEKLYKSEHKNNLLFWMNEQWDEAELFYETTKIVDAFNEYCKEDSQLEAGIITNYKGDKTFERIMNLKIPERFSISYCDKAKTYSTDVREITDSAIASFTKSKGLLGIYPMIAFDLKTFFVWTAPEFIQFRCAEFDRINAHKVMGYTPYACSFLKFNIAAFAEWLWNPKGRNTIDFIRAYSYREGLDFDKYENMLYYLTFASWSLQRSNFVQCISNDPIDFKNLKKLARAKQMATDSLKAVKYANLLENPTLINETTATYAAIKSYIYTKKLLKLSSSKKINKKRYLTYRDKLDEACKSAYTSLMDWAEYTKQEAGAYDTYIYETAKAFLHLPAYFNKFVIETVKPVE